jgi:DNA-binding LytR/AlgR family response regulator
MHKGGIALKIALVDDELTQLTNLQNLLSVQLQALTPSTTHLIDTYRNGRSFLDHWSAGQYDVIILDIFMGGMTGVEVAKQIRRTDIDVKLVFCSHSNEFATESYEVNAQYYLLKPATQGSIVNMLQRLNLELIQRKQFVMLPDGHNIILRDILYTEYYNHVVTIYLKDKETYRIRTNHAIMEELLAPCGFIFSPCKGILVNFYEVATSSDDSFTMTDGTILPISRRRSKEIQSAYIKFRFQKMRLEVEV